MKATSEKAKRRLESKKRKVSAFLQVAELNDSEKRRKILEGSQELDQDAEENYEKTKPKAGNGLFRNDHIFFKLNCKNVRRRPKNVRTYKCVPEKIKKFEY